MSDQHHDKRSVDIEKDSALRSDSPAHEVPTIASPTLLSWGVEARGTVPVPLEERTETHFSKIFFVWFSMNFNILSFSTGTLGPAAFGLDLTASCLVILFFNMLCCALPAYLSTWGPRTGMRQMIHSRYSFGYYGIIIPAILNLIGLCGFNILNCILGGQALSSVSPNGDMSWSVGIVIIGVISLLISFCGFKVLTWYERVAWFPVLVTFIIALGVGGKHLGNPPAAVPATAVTVLGFASTIAGFVITYSAMASDFSNYFEPDVSRTKIFFYSYLGYLIPIIPLECLGAACAIAAPSVPSWNAGYANGNVGGLLEAILSPLGNFGKFLTVLLSLSVTGNIAATLYSICFNFQVCLPVLARVPRYVFSIVGTAIALPLSIVGAHRFYSALTDFLSLIGYWASAYGAVLLIEHHYFRRGDFSTYNINDWNVPRRLPWGAGLLAGVLAFGLIIPSMNQVWFIGPIGALTGDIGFEIAFPLAAVLYVPLRHLELKYQKIE
ncbi:hypothetical protein SERLA73DRAFT_165054 [Serpula lacrymans var. lacrymans S7.3]|uniref:NCS cytosine-purine permease n=1 Tax=Serpula lacrymans var. lacrymans (strain S7.3) TaxID=936435 RepID=F8PKI7_SERL3|nr:hypothetical protein SERLA73DRAFT_165054 [Serpula lacrymans var. lacrymans S7.3]